MNCVLVNNQMSKPNESFALKKESYKLCAFKKRILCEK